ncbi:23S rRNA (guanosine(2251)-2'-O)-methyltransferase RlmB [Spiroplasma endosymbiont of Aspidapion aeneum]|uniref:23S rRNA (guanosine(2251)-2'-O)-methyltransferase RlmB n=1 Tax=Spiroplasma endosymbiont of Aspidapion aeneum TaxID=3066276 RepID=UPI00313D90CE
MFLLKSKNAIEVLILNKPFLIKRIFLCDKFIFDDKIYKAIKSNNIIVENIERKDFLNLIKNGKAKIAAEISEVSYSDFSDIVKLNSKKSKLLILDKIQDPHNFGAIIRSAYLFNFDGIIVLNRNQAPISEVVINSSSGAAFLIDIYRVSNIKNAINQLKKNGYWIYCSYLGNNSQDLESISWDNKSVVVIGNEGDGVSNNIAKISDILFTINTKKNGIDSLNASVAAGIIFYNLNKKQNEHI